MKRWHAAVAWVVAAIAAAVAGQQAWAHDASSGLAGATMTGADVTGGLATTLAWVAVALALLLLVLRRLGSRIIGVLAVVLGLGAVLAALSGTYPAARELTAAAAAQASASPWRWVFASSGAAVALGGVLAALTAPQADRRQRAYSRTATADGESGAADPRDAWKAMDAGDDPTADPR